MFEGKHDRLDNNTVLVYTCQRVFIAQETKSPAQSKLKN